MVNNLRMHRFNINKSNIISVFGHISIETECTRERGGGKKERKIHKRPCIQPLSVILLTSSMGICAVFLCSHADKVV